MPDRELVGVTEIAELLGVAKISAKRYAARDDFAKPVAVLAGGRVWRAEDVLEWAEKHRPSRGRPRKAES